MAYQSWICPFSIVFCFRGSRRSRCPWTSTVWLWLRWSARICKRTWPRTQLSCLGSRDWSGLSLLTQASRCCSIHPFMASATRWDCCSNKGGAGRDPSGRCLCSQVRPCQPTGTMINRWPALFVRLWSTLRDLHSILLCTHQSSFETLEESQSIDLSVSTHVCAAVFCPLRASASPHCSHLGL